MFYYRGKGKLVKVFSGDCIVRSLTIETLWAFLSDSRMVRRDRRVSSSDSESRVMSWAQPQPWQIWEDLRQSKLMITLSVFNYNYNWTYFSFIIIMQLDKIPRSWMLTETLQTRQTFLSRNKPIPLHFVLHSGMLALCRGGLVGWWAPLSTF